MLDLSNYIIEKFKISKDIKVDKEVERALSKDYVFVVAYNDSYEELEDVYADALIYPDNNGPSGDPIGFLLPMNIGETFIDKKDTKVFKIPDKYKYVKDFEVAYINGECSYNDDLEEI